MSLSAKAVSQIADAIKEDIIESIYQSEKFNDIMHELVHDAMLDKLGEMDDILQFEIGMCLIDRIELKWITLKNNL